MFEKVNPSHPDKIADRIAGAIVDLAYKKANNMKELRYEKHPKVACEVLIGHNKCFIINETSQYLDPSEVTNIVERIAGHLVIVNYIEVPQDKILAKNQTGEIKCGDNGIFKGHTITLEQKMLTKRIQKTYEKIPYDGKYIIKGKEIIACQSHCSSVLELPFNSDEVKKFNPLGEWTGGTDVDCGATNRKLGSDMGDAVTGGGLHGKDLSKADVSVNIYCHLESQRTKRQISAHCAIGDEYIVIDNKKIPYHVIVRVAKEYIESIGGFEKFAEWGLIR